MDFLLPSSFCPTAAKGICATALKAAEWPQGSSCLPRVPAPEWSGDRGFQGVPGQGAAEALSRPVPFLRESCPVQRQGEECGHGRTEGFYWGAEKPFRGSIHIPGAHLRGSGLISAPPRSAEPTRSVRIVLFST